MNDEAKKLILEAKNICVIPSQTNEPESLTATLALFYTLKDLQKNVNLIIDDFPEKLNFLVPSLDFISSPKNFVISIPKNVADVSQIYYEKNEENVKIHLTLDRGSIKKDTISLYYSQTKPDLVITLGISNFQKELESKLDSFGFLLGSPILNIDNSEGNTKFGQVNLVESQSLSEVTLAILKSLDVPGPADRQAGIPAAEGDLGKNLIKKETANCILTGLVSYYENFRNAKTTPEVLKTAAQLMERGADHKQILDNLYKTTQAQMDFLTGIFRNLKNENGIYVATLESDNFSGFGQEEATAAMEKINGLGLENSLLTLWNSHSSAPAIKGFFYSKNQHLLNRVAENQQQHIKNNWVFLSMAGEDLMSAKEKITKLLF